MASQDLLKRADPETALEVDTMILDYFMYNATMGLLEERKAAQTGATLADASKPDLPLQMVDAFLRIFQNNHPTAPADPDLLYRLRLLKFTTLFARRLTLSSTTPSASSLNALRTQNTVRAQSFNATQPPTAQLSSTLSTSLPLPLATTTRARSRALSALLPTNPTAARNFYGTPRSATLADILPSFIALSAARQSLSDDGEWGITERWMELAGEWMLQACLEAYLVFRSADPKLAAEVFAWGHRGATSSSPAPDAGTDEAAVNAMFAADPEDGGGELPAWTQAKQEWADKLHPTEGVGLGVHLENLMKEYPIQVFESTVVELLEGLGESLSVPIMVQLEEGVVEGLTEQEVRELRERVGY